MKKKLERNVPKAAEPSAVLAKGISLQLESLTRIHDGILQTIAAAAMAGQAIKQIGEAVVPPSLKAAEWLQSLKSERRRIATRIADFHDDVLKHLTPNMELITEALHDLPRQTKEALIILGEHGWFIDMQMTPAGTWYMRDALLSGKIDEAENLFIKYLEGRLPDIEKSILTRYPHRSRILQAAFDAHRRQQFALSIPVFLAQTDGISHELFNQHLFLSNRGKPRTAIYVESLTDQYLAAMLSPLAKRLPINASKRRNRKKKSAELNRHAVLHGESWDYDSRANGFKAISLINYVAHVVDKPIERPRVQCDA